MSLGEQGGRHGEVLGGGGGGRCGEEPGRGRRGRRRSVAYDYFRRE